MRPLLLLAVVLLLPLHGPVEAHSPWVAGYFVGTSGNATAPLVHVILRVTGPHHADGYHPGLLEIYPMTPPSTTNLYVVRIFFQNPATGTENGPVMDVNNEDATIQLFGVETGNVSAAPMNLHGFAADFGLLNLAGFVGETS